MGALPGASVLSNVEGLTTPGRAILYSAVLSRATRTAAARNGPWSSSLFVAPAAGP